MSALFRDTPAPPAKRDPETGKPHSRYPAEVRERVIEAAYDLILQGATIAQIAHQHGVPPRTLRLWLHADGDGKRYAEARQLWLDQRIAEADMGIEA